MDSRALVTESSRHRILLERAEALAGIGHYRDDLRTGELYWSPGLYDIAGIDALEARDVEHLFAPLFDRDKAQEYVALRDAAAKVGRSYSYEAVIRRPDGEPRTIVNLAVPEFDAEGAVCAFIGVVRDITLERQREKDLCDLAAQYERAEQLARMCHTYEDFEADTLAVSPMFFELTGVAPVEEPLDYHALAETLLDSEQREQAYAFRDHVRKTGEATRFELNLRHLKDGRDVILRSDCVPERDADGRVIGQFAIVRDVTKSRQASQALQTSNRLLERAQTIGLVGHCYDDYVSNVMTASDTFLAIYDYHPEGPFSYADWARAVFDDAGYAHALEVRQAARRDSGAIRMETTFIRRDGQRRYVEVEAEPELDAEGRPIGSFGVVRDITELKRAHAAMRRSNVLLERAQQVSRTGHCYDDYASGVMRCSDMFLEIFGIVNPPETFSYEDWLRTVWGEDRVAEQLAARDASVRARKGVELIATFTHPKDLAPRYVRIRTEPDVGRNGEVVGSFGIVQDITEQERAARDLRRTNRLFDRAQILAHVGHAYYDFAKDQIEASDAFFDIVGITPWKTSPPLREFTELLFSKTEQDEVVRRVSQTAAADGLSSHHSVVIRRADNREVRHLDVVVEQRRDSAGDGIGQFWIIQDVTQLRRTERELRERQVFLTTAQQAARIAPFRYDAVKRTFTTTEPARAFYGWPAGEPLEGPLSLLLDLIVEPADRTRVLDAIDDAMRDETHLQVDFAVSRAEDPSPRHIRVYADPERGPDGGVVAFLGVAQDVTSEVSARRERQALRQQIERSQRVETLGFFVGGLAHEVRNVVQPLPFLSKELAAAIESGRLDDAGGTLDALQIAGERALAAVRDMLDYIRAERDAEPPRQFGSTLDVTRRFVTAALRANFTFSSTPEARDAWVATGRTGFLQIVLNLAQNAVEAGGDSVAVMLHADRVTLAADAAAARDVAAGDYVRVVVVDDGPGLAPGALARIFDRFYSDERERGSGLGLALVRNMVERWGGSIEATSGPDAGVTFDIVLPCAPTPQDATAS